MNTAAPTCPFCGAPLVERLCYGFLHHFRCASCRSGSCYEVAAGQVRAIRCKGLVPLDPITDACPDCGCGLEACPTTATHVRCTGCRSCWTPARTRVLHLPARGRCGHCGGSGMEPAAEHDAAASNGRPKQEAR